MYNLGKKKDIIIIVNKDVLVVIVDTEKRVKEFNCQLSNQNIYKLLQEDPTTTSHQNT